MLADTLAESGNLYVFGMNRVCLEARAICKNGHQPGVVRPGQMKHVKTNRQGVGLRNERFQFPQHSDMLLPQFGFDVSPVFPNDQVSQHDFRVQPKLRPQKEWLSP